ncbi:MAG: undecaprenyldiphospho-muramoylpentapeptide beta-N-acetylglucosaminyltransferase [Rhizobiaceae bacterium]|nr:undecaprenyldiphospho-muramoylpentapeptide beta-N-acetylglucosaminyltransferase [Rhizobiaceae bacterium]
MNKTVLLSAGGTGGHLFPAQALAQEMQQRGWSVHLATDPRAKKFVDSFPADQVHIIPSATFAGKNPLALLRTLYRLASGYFMSRRLLARVKPHAVVGFGGYPTVPPLLAAAHKGHPAILHEQNAIMGRANRFLASRVTAIATGFALEGEQHPESAPVTVTGNPLRDIAHQAALQPYVPHTLTGPFKLLVFGGSQGARFFSQVMPAALALLDDQLRSRVNLILQARPEDANQVRAGLSKLNVDAEVSDFFTDMPGRIAQSHLVICRAGASSVSELALIGCPSILVPLPGALDDDQGANAAHLADAEGALLVRQKDLTPEKLAKLLSSAMKHPQTLAIQAENAKKAGVADAAVRLADLVQVHVG